MYIRLTNIKLVGYLLRVGSDRTQDTVLYTGWLLPLELPPQGHCY